MAKNDGWIKIWRKSINNELYFLEPFDKWHAWEDLLLLAEYDSRTGQSGKLEISLEALKIRWSWSSVHKVRAFLGKLKGKGMVTLSGRPTGTLVTIVNWELYQGSPQAFGQTKRTLTGTPNGKQEYIYIKKNNKEDKEDKENRVSSNEEEIFMTGEEMRKKWNTSST